MSLKIQSSELQNLNVQLPPIDKVNSAFKSPSAIDSQETPRKQQTSSIKQTPKQQNEGTVPLKTITISEQDKYSDKENDGPQKSDSFKDKDKSQEISFEEETKEEVQETPWWKKILLGIIDHWTFTCWMTTLTIYALFGDDIRVAGTDKPADTVFYILSITCLFFFSFEIFCSCLCKANYWLGFFFWLDLMSTLSLIPDIGWIWDPIMGTDSSSSNAAQTTQIARAGRASRAGTRAGRVIRIIRLIRLIRIVKLYKLSQQAQKEAADKQHQDDQQISAQELAKQARTNINQKDQSSSSQDEEAKSQRRKSQISTSNTAHRKSVRVVNSENIPAKNHQIEEFQEKSISQNLDQQKNNEEQNKQVTQNLSLPEFGIQKEMTYSRQDSSMGMLQNGDMKMDQGQEDMQDYQEPKIEMPDESKVGRKLSDLTTKRVIILVLSMMFGLQLFVTETYVEANTSYQFGLDAMDFYIQRQDYSNFLLSYQSYLSLHIGDRIPLLYLEVDNIYAGVQNPYEDEGTNYEDLRTSEIEFVFLTDDEDYRFNSIAVFDIRADTRLQAILSIVRTVFICIVLAVGSILFSKDTNDIILGPIENMIQKVTKISQNPLQAAQEEEQLEYQKAMVLQQGKKNEKEKGKKEAPMETEFLEKTIIQIGALLALGFGEAGSEVIAQNMSSGGGEVDPMIPGKKTMAIFGFCDIRNFTDATEVLQEGVMVFVNEIAEIVHSVVDKFSGSANKNIGDAFLLVWKFPEDQIEIKKNQDGEQEMKLVDSHIVKQIADMSVISFLKIVGKINRSNKLVKYSKHEGLNQRMENYKVRMGFGLHVGWSIEGAIGSEFKIDASYLSPNVNMASRLEAATKQFGVPLLYSGQIVAICSPELRDQMRQIDRVTVKGSIQPLDLYTCDLDPDCLAPDGPDQIPETQEIRKRKKIRQRIQREQMREKAFDKNKNMPIFSIMLTDPDIQEMRKHITRQFLDQFKQGFEYYIKGEWESAQRLLVEAQKLRNRECHDGPTAAILDTIKENSGKAPSDWKGYRELTEK